MAEGKFNKQEIESHSSNLFNQRIDQYFKLIAEAELVAMNKLPPNIQDVISYHASLFALWMEVNSAFEDYKEMNDEIIACKNNGEVVAKFLRMKPEAKQYNVEWMLQNCKKWHYLMHRGLQNMRYFFRFGKTEPRGIKQILEIFKQTDWKEEDGNKIPASGQ